MIGESASIFDYYVLESMPMADKVNRDGRGKNIAVACCWSEMSFRAARHF